MKLSLGDFVTKAVAMALRIHPGLNASFEPDAIVRHGEINLGIAVALNEGLIVPVLHQADTLGLAEIRRQSETLVAAARSNNLSTEQLTGSTFTISNLGHVRRLPVRRDHQPARGRDPRRRPRPRSGRSSKATRSCPARCSPSP